MPLSPEQEWTLISCGMLALADRVLTGGEASRLLGLVESYLGPEEQDHWMDLVSDRGALEAHFEGMEAPPAAEHLKILERVWQIALADGDTSLSEIRVIERIGARFGIDRGQLAVLRKTWTYAAIERAEVVAGFIAGILSGDDEAAARRAYGAVLGRLPLRRARREELLGTGLGSPPELTALAPRLGRLSEGEQRQLLEALLRELRGLRKLGDEAVQRRLRDLLSAAGLPESRLTELVDRAAS